MSRMPARGGHCAIRPRCFVCTTVFVNEASTRAVRSSAPACFRCDDNFVAAVPAIAGDKDPPVLLVARIKQQANFIKTPPSKIKHQFTTVPFWKIGFSQPPPALYLCNHLSSQFGLGDYCILCIVAFSLSPICVFRRIFSSQTRLNSMPPRCR